MFRIQPFGNYVRNILLVIASLMTASLASGQIYNVLFTFNGTDGSSPSDPQVLTQGRDGNLYGTLPSGGLSGGGTVFKMTTAGVQTIIHNFSGTDGFRPNAGLALGLDGNFYGSTVNGGTFGLGEVFQITPAGVLTVLYNFSGGTDGAYPYATPTLGNDGNFYGVTQNATAYKITPGGVFTLLGTIPDRSYAPLLLGSDGNFYGTTQHGGTFLQGTVFKMTPSGVVTVLYNFDTTHGGVPWAGVVQGGDGGFYGTTTGGGTLGGGVVFRLTSAGAIKLLHNFPVGSIDDGSDPIAGVTLATDGTFYGATSTGGANGYGVLFKLAPTGTYTFIYQFDKVTGQNPSSNLTQHTNGSVYGLANGGTLGDGVFYGLSLNLGTKVRLMLSSGKVASTVQILGSGFTGTTAVKFNGTAATFTVVSDTYMTAKVPAGATTGFVNVTTPGGTFASMSKFLVIPKVLSFNPTSGSVGTSVVITGNSFTGATKVTFGGVAATTFSVDSDSQITATVPTGAVTGKVGVTTAGGTGLSSSTFTVI